MSETGDVEDAGPEVAAEDVGPDTRPDFHDATEDADDARVPDADGPPPDLECDPNPVAPRWTPCPDGDVPPGAYSVVRAPTPVPADGFVACGPGCRQIASGDVLGYFYDVWGDVVVQFCGRYPDPGYFHRIILLDTGEVFRIDMEFPERGERVMMSPVVADGVVYYSSYEEAVDGVERWRLWSYDTRTWRKTALVEWDSPVVHWSSDEGRHLRLFDLYPGRGTGIWARVPGSDVFLFDPCVREFRPVGPFNCCTGHPLNPPRLWGPWMMQSSDAFGAAVYAYDERTDVTWCLRPGTADQQDPALHGTIAVWSDSRNGNGSTWAPDNLDIFGIDLEEMREFAIVTDPAFQEFPDVHGCRVVWQDARDDRTAPNSPSAENVNIYMRDLRTWEETRLTDALGWEIYPRIWGDRVFYFSLVSTGGGALFMIDLTER
jgi:hypothetical protein